MVSQYKSLWDSHFGGLLLACVIAAAAMFLSEHYGAPAMLFALLIGMAFHFLSDDPTFAPGFNFSAKTLLRLGVGRLGLRLSIGDVESIVLGAVAAVVGFVMATLAFGAFLSFLFGRRLAFGLLAGGSVAICGASAALAIASVLPPAQRPRTRHPIRRDRRHRPVDHRHDCLPCGVSSLRHVRSRKRVLDWCHHSRCGSGRWCGVFRQRRGRRHRHIRQNGPRGTFTCGHHRRHGQLSRCAKPAGDDTVIFNHVHRPRSSDQYRPDPAKRARHHRRAIALVPCHRNIRARRQNQPRNYCAS